MWIGQIQHVNPVPTKSCGCITGGLQLTSIATNPVKASESGSKWMMLGKFQNQPTPTTLTHDCINSTHNCQCTKRHGQGYQAKTCGYSPKCSWLRNTLFGKYHEVNYHLQLIRRSAASTSVRVQGNPKTNCPESSTIQWMEEILHQLIVGVSQSKVVQHFFHPSIICYAQ